MIRSLSPRLALSVFVCVKMKYWNLHFTITMGMAWLQRDPILPQQRMIIVCHLHCQAACTGYHPLQGQAVDLRERHGAELAGAGHILSHCCQSKAPSEENAGK